MKFFQGPVSQFFQETFINWVSVLFTDLRDNDAARPEQAKRFFENSPDIGRWRREIFTRILETVFAWIPSLFYLKRAR